MDSRPSQRPIRVMILGVGAFAHGTAQILKDAGASVITCLTRRYGHHPPTMVGPTFGHEAHPNPVPLIRELKVDFVIPQSIDWAQASWAEDLLRYEIPILSPTGEAMLIERDRDYARRICQEHGIPVPRAHVAANRLMARRLLDDDPRAYVIKNPLCSPTSPVHTILCETVEDTRAWLDQVDYAEGVFLQEYLGTAEAGHIALVSGGEIHPLVTNQEYKRAHAGNLGIVCGGPLGGVVEKDPDDQYGLARELIHPLKPWFKRVAYNGPIQVTACKTGGKWKVVEYNVRLGITSGAMILRLLDNPLETLFAAARNQKLAPRFRDDVSFGCSMTLAGYGYPYAQMRGPRFPIRCMGTFDCDVWWNDVAPAENDQLQTSGHRIADVVACGETLGEAVHRAKRNIRQIRCLGSFYRTDIGETLWPPGRAD